MGLFTGLKVTPEKMRAKLLKDAQMRLIEAEHAASRWKHAANQAREEIEQLTAGLTGSNNKLADLAKPPTVAQVAKQVEEVSRRSFIGQPTT